MCNITRYFMFLLLLLCISCSDIKSTFFKDGISEGIIKYDLSFPYLDEDQMQVANLLPDEMVYSFKKNENQSEISSIGFKAVVHANEQKKEVNQYIKVLSKKVMCNYDEFGVKELLKTYPDLHVIRTSETDTIAGVLCKKAIGVYSDISKPSMEIYYTEEFDVKAPNWCNQFAAIDGVLMGFEMEQFNLRMRMKAYEFVDTADQEIEFMEDDSYNPVDANGMNHELEEIFISFF